MSWRQLYGDLFSSGEFELLTRPIARLYSATFARPPDGGGLRYWQRRFANSGESLEQIAELFASSPEFLAAGELSNVGYVNRLYLNVLGRLPDDDSLAFWRDQLDARLVTRGQLLARFSESPEYIATTRAKSLLDLANLLILNGPTEKIVNFDQQGWINALQGGLASRDFATAFAASQEYASRFVVDCRSSNPPIPNPPAYCPR